jgi:oligo-1,6-glucosidase
MNETKWWHHRIIYQIYPRSFADSNDDGIGDIPGIISKLDYLKDLGVGALWLSPVYKSPNADNGYDISDYRDINPEYGTLDDMKRLIKEATARDIKIVMDLVINHTSDEHHWFQASIDPKSPYHDYYIWRPGVVRNGKELPPNNWHSQFTGSAWSKHPVNSLYYLHLFTPKQPDLNYHNPKVIEEVKSLMKFWLDLGVAGFRCDVINMIYKTSLADGKKRLFGNGQEHYLSQPGSHSILKQFHDEIWSPYGAFTVGETVGLDGQKAQAYTDEQLETVFQFDHTNADRGFLPIFENKYRPERMKRILYKWQHLLDWNTLFFENHDIPRSVSRFGDDKQFRYESATMLATLMLTLRGTPFIYQGQEIGTTNTHFNSIDELDDVSSHNVYRILRGYRLPKRIAWKMVLFFTRDHARTPMAWNKGKNGGFSNGKPWLRLNDFYETINVEEDRKSKQSIGAFYRTLIKLRNKSEALQVGTIKFSNTPKDVLSYQRTLNDEMYHIIVNLGSKNRRLTKTIQGALILSNYEISSVDLPEILHPYQILIIKKN